MNPFVKLVRSLLKVDNEVTEAVDAKREELLNAAETFMPNFAKIRDEKAKAGVLDFKDGRDQVRLGTRKMDDGEEAVELAQVLGSRVKLPR
ncbi:hypothetical protein COY48_03085 [Candidatus Collierbacteria bacterium CG_4_10_14_0_8_um_filter_43_86]|nr:MAG: hypothetical protein COY48_03085 [Candidatus Collierbacteria bacterium CG_4_10_14_0_8_um_filter_43_86]